MVNRRTTYMLIFSLFLSGVFVNAQEIKEEVLWSTTYKEALQQAKEEKKPVLVYFKGSDWCAPCKKLDTALFSTDKFKNLAKKNFVLYEADIPYNKDLVEKEKLKTNLKLVKKFKVKSYPTLVFINRRQKVLGVKKGMILSEYYYPFFKSIIAKK